MTSKTKTKNDVNVLRHEASKMMEDLAHLAEALAEVGEHKTDELKTALGDKYSKEIESLKERLEGISEKVTELAKSTNKHVHANPYLYILGSLGLGLLLGKFLAPRSRD